MVDRLRLVDLLDHPFSEDRDPVRHADRLDLIVRHVHERPAEVALQALELDPHLESQEGIERRDRLVKEVGARLAHDRAPERDPLTLPSGELRRLAREQVFDVEHARGRLDAPRDLVLRHLPPLERKG
jgi:hypothetical protein